MNRLDTDDTLVPLKPAKAARIGHAHSIRLGKDGQSTPWDESYEHIFQEADNLFPSNISKFEAFADKTITKPIEDRFTAHTVTEAECRAFAESLVSLVVRSPEFREKCVGVAEHCRGPLPERERNTLISLNQRHCHRAYADSFASRCKFVVLVTDNREFIYGDGMYSDMSPLSAPAPNPSTLLSPITPQISVLMTQPMAYAPQPRLVSTLLTDDEVGHLNHFIQIHSKQYLFYRDQRPELSDAFRSGTHLMIDDYPHPVSKFIRTIPGVRPSPFGLGA